MPHRLRIYIYKFLPLILLAFYFLSSFSGMLKESVTVDEFNHLPAGYSYLKTGSFHLCNTNPPLGKVLAAIPLWIKNADFIRNAAFEKGDFWAYSYDFMRLNRHVYRELFTDARIVIILLGLLAGCLVFFWAKDLYGFGAACMALFLYSFCPNVLAHSHLVTTDMAAATFMVAALYFFYGWMKQKTLARTFFAGVFLGLAQLTKFSALILYIVIIPFFFFSYLKKRNPNRDLLQFSAILLLSIFVINAGYLFRGSFTPLGQFQFKSKSMQSIEKQLPGSLRIPLPYDYISGFDFQKNETEGKYFQFLMGKISRQGWWYYYLAAFLFKVPVALIILWLFLIGLRVTKRLPRLDGGEALILSAAILYTVIISLGVRHNLGFRFMLPVLPLLYVLAGRIILAKIRQRYKIALVTAISLFYAFESLSVFPHYLSFFNLFAGGPKNGYNYLIDSNIDWGQDLPLLKEYLEKNKLDSIDLAYFGRVDPAIYGINYRILNRETKEKRVAVSVNYYQGYPYLLFKDYRLYPVPPGYYEYLHQYPIRERIGYSILVIEIP
jgi:hypothetical protein